MTSDERSTSSSRADSIPGEDPDDADEVELELHLKLNDIVVRGADTSSTPPPSLNRGKARRSSGKSTSTISSHQKSSGAISVSSQDRFMADSSDGGSSMSINRPPPRRIAVVDNEMGAGNDTAESPSSTAEDQTDSSLEHLAKDPFYDLGLTTFNFCLFPEGNAMQKYNLTNPKAHFAIFISEEAKASGSAMTILQDYIKSIHPDDLQFMASYIDENLKVCKNWDDGHQDDDHQHSDSASQFRAKIPGKGYRWQELRNRLTREQTEDGSFIILCDGAFLDITDLKEREQELERNSQALEREIHHHRSTQAALTEAMEDIREANRKLEEQQQLRELQSLSSGSQRLSKAQRRDIIEDLTAMKGLIESCEFPGQKWLKIVYDSLATKLSSPVASDNQGNSDRSSRDGSHQVPRTIDDVSEVSSRSGRYCSGS